MVGMLVVHDILITREAGIKVEAPPMVKGGEKVKSPFLHSVDNHFNLHSAHNLSVLVPIFWKAPT